MERIADAQSLCGCTTAADPKRAFTIDSVGGALHCLVATARRRMMNGTITGPGALLCGRSGGKMRVLFGLIAPCLLTTQMACTITPKTEVVENQANSERMPFIRDGITSRLEIYNRLGEPAYVYEDGRVITYRMHDRSLSGLDVVAPSPMPKQIDMAWKWNLYSLVLVFGNDDTLERHSLVFIR